MRKKLLYLLLFFAILYLHTEKSYAASLGNASDILSTSRPSASTPLSTDVPASSTFVSVYSNGSIFLASDSAKLWGGTPETVTVATVSSSLTKVFFPTLTTTAHTNGTVISVPITAMHTVKFVTQTNLPATGSIVLTFPMSSASDTNLASPSATSFMLNGLTAGNIKTNAVTCGSYVFVTTAGQPQTITCNLSASVTANTAVTFLIGCTSSTGATCTTQHPTLINPTKTAAAGTADSWLFNINTYDGASGTGTALDNAKIQIGTVESINIVGHIDPTFSFVISGVADGTSVNTLSFCGVSHAAAPSNTGFSSTSTDVNLGTLTPGNANRSYQTMLIQSNAVSGYVITATSSGHLLNPTNGFYIQDNQGTPTGNDNPAPVGISSNAFGITACDANGKVDITKWGQSNAFYANPSASFYYTLVTSTTGPANGGDIIVVGYVAKVTSSTPPGDYRTTLTYVATPIF